LIFGAQPAIVGDRRFGGWRPRRVARNSFFRLCRLTTAWRLSFDTPFCPATKAVSPRFLGRATADARSSRPRRRARCFAGHIRIHVFCIHATPDHPRWSSPAARRTGASSLAGPIDKSFFESGSPRTSESGDRRCLSGVRQLAPSALRRNQEKAGWTIAQGFQRDAAALRRDARRAQSRSRVVSICSAGRGYPLAILAYVYLGGVFRRGTPVDALPKNYYDALFAGTNRTRFQRIQGPNLWPPGPTPHAGDPYTKLARFSIVCGRILKRSAPCSRPFYRVSQFLSLFFLLSFLFPRSGAFGSTRDPGRTRCSRTRTGRRRIRVSGTVVPRAKSLFHRDPFREHMIGCQVAPWLKFSRPISDEAAMRLRAIGGATRQFLMGSRLSAEVRSSCCRSGPLCLAEDGAVDVPSSLDPQRDPRPSFLARPRLD